MIDVGDAETVAVGALGDEMVTVTVAVKDVPPGPVQLTVYVVFAVGETENEPEVAVPEPKFLVQLVALVEDHVIVDD